MVFTMFDGIAAALGVTIIASILLIVINAFYRFLINQDRAAELKARIQQLGKESRGATPDRQKELMSQTMHYQKEMMHMNMKPMLLSFVIVAVLLPWLGSIYHDANFGLVDGVGGFTLADANYTARLVGNQVTISGSSSEVSCNLPCDLTLVGVTRHASVSGNNGVQLSLVAAVLPGLPIVGGWQLGWIWWYILVSIPLAIIIRAAYGIRS